MHVVLIWDGATLCFDQRLDFYLVCSQSNGPTHSLEFILNTNHMLHCFNRGNVTMILWNPVLCICPDIPCLIETRGLWGALVTCHPINRDTHLLWIGALSSMKSAIAHVQTSLSRALWVLLSMFGLDKQWNLPLYYLLTQRK